jgi:Trk K+ transport system NAD-binding subunit
MGSLAQLPSARPRCILVGDSTGDSRLAVAVAAELIHRGATVVIVAGCDATDCARVERAVERNVDPAQFRFETRWTNAELLAERLTVTPLSGERDLETALQTEPARLRDGDCLLALSEDLEHNLRAALVANRVAARVRVILRAFDPELAEELEGDGGNTKLSVRRAYSVAHLSAPSFVARALLREGRCHVTMRAGVEYISVCQLPVDGTDEHDPVGRSRRNKSKGLLGRTPAQIAQDDGCQVLARRRDGEDVWCRTDPPDQDTPLAPGDEVLVGGPLSAVLELARGRPSNCIDRCGRRIEAVKARLTGTQPPHSVSASGRREVTKPPLRDLIAARWSLGRTLSATLSVRLLIVMGLMVTVASVVVTPGHRPSDLVYQWASTALGNPADTSAGGVAEDLMAALGILAGGVALGLGTSLMSTALIQRRMMEGMRRRAQRLKHHVIIVGLSDLSASVAARLRDLDIPCVVVEPSAPGDALSLPANPAFVEVAEHSPVLVGELGEILARARLDRADALIALSKDNLVNVEACIRAKRQRGVTGLRTVARIFDDVNASEAAENLGVDDPIAAVSEVAPEFADAALEDLPMRTIHLSSGKPSSRDNAEAGGQLPLAAVKWPGHRGVDGEELARWHGEGIRVLRHKRRSSTTAPVALESGDVAVLAGPRSALSRVEGLLPTDSPATNALSPPTRQISPETAAS